MQAERAFTEWLRLLMQIRKRQFEQINLKIMTLYNLVRPFVTGR